MTVHPVFLAKILFLDKSDNSFRIELIEGEPHIRKYDWLFRCSFSNEKDYNSLKVNTKIRIFTYEYNIKNDNKMWIIKIEQEKKPIHRPYKNLV